MRKKKNRCVVLVFVKSRRLGILEVRDNCLIGPHLNIFIPSPSFSFKPRRRTSSSWPFFQINFFRGHFLCFYSGGAAEGHTATGRAGQRETKREKKDEDTK